jgi:carbon monoxide dehydrogenase subunit G
MSRNSAEVSIQVNNTPEAIIDYVADVNNRTLYLPSLSAVANINREEGEVGTSWRWTWTLLGVDFEGVGHCTEYVPGYSYSFVTEGGIASKFTYRAESAGDGTQLTIRVEFDVPESLLSQVGIDALIESAKQSETEQIANNLKTILDQ